MPRKRVLSPSTPVADSDETAAILDLIAEPAQETAQNAPEAPQDPVPPPGPIQENQSLDAYLRAQVRMEMYGRDDPSDHDIALSALRNHL